MREDKTFDHDAIEDLGAASEVTLGDIFDPEDESFVQPDSRA